MMIARTAVSHACEIVASQFDSESVIDLSVKFKPIIQIKPDDPDDQKNFGHFPGRAKERLLATFLYSLLEINIYSHCLFG